MKAISECMDVLAWVRGQRADPEWIADRTNAMINEVGELDQLSELHRLLYEFGQGDTFWEREAKAISRKQGV